MDLPPTSGSAIGLRDAAGFPVPEFIEWTPAVLTVACPVERWPDLRLTVQGAPAPTTIRRILGEPVIAADWPRSGPGHYRIEAWLDGALLDRRLLTIRPRKISEPAFLQLLSDLETRLPVAIAVGLQRGGGLTGVSLLDPERLTPAQELARLRRAILGLPERPGLAAVLRELASDPHRVLRSTEPWVRRDQARRPHPSRLASALVRGGNLDEQRIPLVVIDGRPEQTADTYENRLLRLFVHQAGHRLRRLTATLTRLKQTTPLAEAQEMERDLAQARQAASFLDEVRLPTTLPTTPSMVLLRRPPYKAALAGYLDFQRHPAVLFDDPRIEAPLENLPELYQTWCTLQVLDVVLASCVDAGFVVTQERLTAEDGGGVYVRVLPDGRPALTMRHPETGTDLTVIPERSYGRTGAVRSVSYEQRPDIAIEIRQPGAGTTVIVLDPKYKLDGETQEDADSTGSALKVDIDKMHTYRDAIRDGENRRVVRLAAILYPGPTTPFGPDVAAVRALPGADAEMKAWIGQQLWSVVHGGITDSTPGVLAPLTAPGLVDP